MCVCVCVCVTYWLLDLHFSFYSLPSDEPQLSWRQASHQLNPALCHNASYG